MEGALVALTVGSPSDILHGPLARAGWGDLPGELHREVLRLVPLRDATAARGLSRGMRDEVDEGWRAWAIARPRRVPTWDLAHCKHVYPARRGWRRGAWCLRAQGRSGGWQPPTCWVESGRRDAAYSPRAAGVQVLSHVSLAIWEHSIVGP